MSTDAALTVKEVRTVFLTGCIVANDLRPTHIGVSDATIGGVKHKKTTWHPLVHIAGQDRDRGCVGCRYRMPLVDPFADKDLQALVLWSRFGKLVGDVLYHVVRLVELSNLLSGWDYDWRCPLLTAMLHSFPVSKSCCT